MPCPPSLEEQQLTRYELQLAEAEAMIAKLAPGLASALEVALTLLERHPERGAAATDLAPSIAYARTLREHGIPRYVDPPGRFPNGVTTIEEAADRAMSMQTFYADVATRLELALCVMGTFVACVVRDIGAPPVTDPFAAAVTAELARHRAHREEERAHALTLLTYELEWRGRSDDEPNARAVRERMAAIRAIDAVTLCTDRTCL